MECIFCSIVKKQSFANIYKENDCCIAIVPKDIEIDGHLLIIPKQHYQSIIDIDNKILSETIIFTKNICIELKEKYLFQGFNMLNANGIAAQQSVSHFHIHILPRNKGDNINAWPKLHGGINIYKKIINNGD